MVILYNLLVAIAVIIAIVFSLLVLLTGKGDAMNGGSSVRTTFKGKASFDDIMSRWTLIIGASFMAIVLLVDVVAKGIEAPRTIVPMTGAGVNAPVPTDAPPVNVPSNAPPATTLQVAPPGAPATTNAPATKP